MKKHNSDFAQFLRKLTLDLFHKNDSFALAKTFAEAVVKYAQFDSALLIWPDYGSNQAAPLKIEHIGRKKIQGYQKVYSTRFQDQDDTFFRVEFYYESKRVLTSSLKHQLKQAEDIVKKSIEANEARLRKEEVDRFIWMRHLSAGISHELNTPLTTLLFYTSKLLKEYPGSQTGEQIKASIGTIEKTLSQYKIMSGDGQFVNFETWSVDNLFKRIKHSLKILFKEHYRWIEFEVSSHDEHVSIQILDIENVIAILVKNAIEAIGVEHSSPNIKITFRVNKGKLHLSVSDNGCGIKAEHRPYIFAPSFSTKDISQGSGFGLSLARAIAFLNEGNLRLNALSEKTQFVLEIPIKEVVSHNLRKAV